MISKKVDKVECLLAATRYLDGGFLPDCLRHEEQRCGEPTLRLALFTILEWLRYVGRGGRERDSKKIMSRGPAPLNAVSNLLSCGGVLSQMFELQGDTILWSAAVSELERALIAKEIAEKWPPRIRV